MNHDDKRMAPIVRAVATPVPYFASASTTIGQRKTHLHPSARRGPACDELTVALIFVADINGDRHVPTGTVKWFKWIHCPHQRR
jgi:hypothetical protein